MQKNVTMQRTCVWILCENTKVTYSMDFNFLPEWETNLLQFSSVACMKTLALTLTLKSTDHAQNEYMEAKKKKKENTKHEFIQSYHSNSFNAKNSLYPSYTHLVWSYIHSLIFHFDLFTIFYILCIFVKPTAVVLELEPWPPGGPQDRYFIKYRNLS